MAKIWGPGAVTSFAEIIYFKVFWIELARSNGPSLKESSLSSKSSRRSIHIYKVGFLGCLVSSSHSLPTKIFDCDEETRIFGDRNFQFFREIFSIGTLVTTLSLNLSELK